jgi:hypothetical protein
VRKKIDWLGVSLLIYILLVSVYMCYGLPQLFTRVTLLANTYGSRPFLGLLVADIAFCVCVLASRDKHERRLGVRRAAAAFIIFAAGIGSFAWYWSHINGEFLTGREVVAAAAMYGLLYAALVAGRTRLFASVALGLALASGAWVNPISRGLSPIFDKDLAAAVRSVTEGDPAARWAIFGNRYGANFMKALGVDAFNGLQHVPDLASMAVLDPTGLNRVYYNRYADVEMHGHPGAAVEFENAGSGPLWDHISILVNPESTLLSQLGIKYVLLPVVARSDRDFYDFDAPGATIRRLFDRPINGYWLCRRMSVP